MLLMLMMVALVRPAAAELYVYEADGNLEDAMDGPPSSFGPGLPLRGLVGFLIPGRPADGCSPLEILPPTNDPHVNFFVLLARAHNCTPTQQVVIAERAGFRGVIVHNVGSDKTHSMQGQDIVHIPSVFIGEGNGMILRANFLYGTGYYVRMTSDYSLTFYAFLLPVLLASFGCMFILCGVQVYRCVHNRRRAWRLVLPQKILDAIPTKSFVAGADPWETCAICLEDYVDTDVVRILPCNHAFHRDCVDPWLTRSKRVCPVCKRRLLSATSAVTVWDSDDDEEEDAAPESERRPLIAPRARRSYGTSVTPRRLRQPDTRAAHSLPTDCGSSASPAPDVDPSRRRQVLAEALVHHPSDVARSSRHRRQRRDRYRRLAEETAQADAARGGTGGATLDANVTASGSTGAAAVGAGRSDISVEVSADSAQSPGGVQPSSGAAGGAETPPDVLVVASGETQQQTAEVV